MLRSNEDHLLYMCGIEDCSDIPKRGHGSKVNAAHVVSNINQSFRSFFPCRLATFETFAAVELLLHHIIHHLKVQMCQGHVRTSKTVGFMSFPANPMRKNESWIQLNSNTGMNNDGKMALVPCLRSFCGIEGLLQKGSLASMHLITKTANNRH